MEPNDAFAQAQAQIKRTLRRLIALDQQLAAVPPTEAKASLERIEAARHELREVDEAVKSAIFHLSQVARAAKPT